MHQISEMADAALNRISREIGEAERKIEKGALEKSAAFSEAFDVFDEHGLEGKEARFLADDGHYIARQMRSRTGKLDGEAVHKALLRHYGKKDGERLWDMITVKTVDPNKLSQALLSQTIEMDVVENLLPDTTYEPARIRAEWTKADKEKAAIFGIEVVPN